jgi:dihydroxyacid dehydratase/phosphogluconate dehydratase
MLYAVGLTEEDMHKAQIGIASLWWEGSPHPSNPTVVVSTHWPIR